MNKLFLIIFFIIFCWFNANGSDYTFTPININFSGIVSSGDTIAAYGDYGSMLISYNNGDNWNQIRVFERGDILKLIFNKGKILAFGSLGKISESMDGGKSWQEQTDLGDTLITVLPYAEGYFVRTYSKIFSLNNQFKKIKSINLFSVKLGTDYKFQYLRSLLFWNDYLVTATDSAKFIRYTENLFVYDTVSLTSAGLCDTCFSNYELMADSDYVYVFTHGNFYKTQNFKTFEKVDFPNTNGFDKIINKKIYHLSFPGATSLYQNIFYLKLLEVIPTEISDTLIQLNINEETYHPIPNDFIIHKNKLFVAGSGKFIASFNFNDTVYTLHSEFSGFTPYSYPIQLSDSSSFLYFDETYSGVTYPWLYRTDDNGITFRPTVEILKNDNFNHIRGICFKYYDPIEEKLFLGGISNLGSSESKALISDDFGRNFTPKDAYGFSFNDFIYFPKIYRLPNVQKIKNNLILVNNIQYPWGTIYTKIFTYSESFDLISRYIDSNMVIDYVHSTDTNTFLIHDVNLQDTTLEIKFTSDKGANWDIVKKYGKYDSLLYYKEISIKDSNYLAMFQFNDADSLCTLELLNLDSRVLNKIYQYKIPVWYYEAKLNNAIDADQDTVYLVIKDTIFYTSDIFDKSSWKYWLLPYSGKITETFKKYGDKFFARYSDSIHADNLYRIKISPSIPEPEPIISVEDYDFGKWDIGNKNYLTYKLTIENQSDNANLLISSIHSSNDTVFVTDLPEIESQNPLIIEPHGFYNFDIIFKPSTKNVFRDSIVFSSNAKTIDSVCNLIGEGIDTTTGVENYEVEDMPYFYAYPPFPLPAENQIRSLIYWNTSVDIEKDEIDVFDIYGNKVSGNERISIEKTSSYSGYLVWDCSGFDSGIYLIQVKHGLINYVIKVIITR